MNGRKMKYSLWFFPFFGGEMGFAMLTMSVRHSVQCAESFFIANGPESQRFKKSNMIGITNGHMWGRKQASQIYHSLKCLLYAALLHARLKIQPF